ncbi:sugar transferase [Pleurocapsa sp. CCALA 161]|uniref:sugar transferase n=1 Tax=Pleurocapsa sp. CCALA 161 TaxID=2107688 RepID=UPI0021007BCE|nr:sugar transferase [Pleurocapsa sp. CCALA 161]
MRSSRVFSFSIKRILDILLSSFILIVVTIPMVIVIAMIKIDSPGSPFFCQTRIGLKGKPFQILKLRTMVANAAQIQMSLENSNEIEGGVLFKIKEDPRITRVGKLLRRYSIDEIPQLINVIKGEMSLVGPRPLTIRDLSKLPENQFLRHEVLPGITGFWQVSGRSETSSAYLGKCDRFYVNKWSLSLDLSILIRTIAVVIAGQGAY